MLLGRSVSLYAASSALKYKDKLLPDAKFSALT